MGSIHPNAQPFFQKGTKDIACLLIHGFTGSPADLRPLAAKLNEQGYTVSGPLLPGHGTAPEEMALTGWPDWYRAAEEEYLKLAQEYRQVFVLGFSMGGLLAIKLAAAYQVHGLVCLSAALVLKESGFSREELLNSEYLHKERSEEERLRNQQEGRFSYDLIPVRALLSLQKLIDLVKADLGKVTCPALILQSEDDPTVDPESARLLLKGLGSINKSVTMLKSSGHLITIGPEQEIVNNRIVKFLARLEINYDHHCFGCGERNPAGLKLRFEYDRAEGKVSTTFLPTENYQGYPGIMHGGIIAAILDETMSQFLYWQGLAAVTARLEIRYRQSVPLGRPITVEARLIKRKSSLLDLEGRLLLDNGQVAAESFGRFMLIGGQND